MNKISTPLLCKLKQANKSPTNFYTKKLHKIKVHQRNPKDWTIQRPEAKKLVLLQVCSLCSSCYTFLRERARRLLSSFPLGMESRLFLAQLKAWFCKDTAISEALKRTFNRSCCSFCSTAFFFSIKLFKNLLLRSNSASAASIFTFSTPSFKTLYSRKISRYGIAFISFYFNFFVSSSLRD